MNAEDRASFNNDARNYALVLVEEGSVAVNTMLLVMLKYMSSDDVRGALDANELSPRFNIG